MVRIHKLLNTIPFLWLSCTNSYHYCMIFCKALLFFLYVQKNQPTCWQNLGWCLVDMSSGRLGLCFFPNVRPTFSTFCQHADMCWDDMSFGGSWQHDTMPTFPTKLKTYWACSYVKCKRSITMWWLVENLLGLILWEWPHSQAAIMHGNSYSWIPTLLSCS